MQIVKTLLRRFKYLLKTIYYSLQGIPLVSDSQITREIIREYIGKEDPTILEIGSNGGEHTLWFHEMFSNPKIYCFEPDPRAIARFKKKVGRLPNINLFEIALCDQNGEVVFYQSSGHKNEENLKSMPDGWDLSGSVRQPKDHLIAYPWVKFDQKINVKASTLDTWCQQHGIGDIDFIWMDVQGAEIDVFRGGVDTLNKTRFIYTEYSNQELYKGQRNLIHLMKQLKHFSIITRYPNDILIRNKRMVTKRNNSL